jgi:uncharacterized lipoprotein YehR (DUF1307 family)
MTKQNTVITSEEQQTRAEYVNQLIQNSPELKAAQESRLEILKELVAQTKEATLKAEEAVEDEALSQINSYFTKQPGKMTISISTTKDKKHNKDYSISKDKHVSIIVKKGDATFAVDAHQSSSKGTIYGDNPKTKSAILDIKLTQGSEELLTVSGLSTKITYTDGSLHQNLNVNIEADLQKLAGEHALDTSTDSIDIS